MKKILKTLTVLLSLLCLSCVSIDFDEEFAEQPEPSLSSREKGGAKAKKNAGIEIVLPPPEVVIVERPVFVPEKEAGRPAPPSGYDAVKNSNNAGIIKPSDYSHAAVVYDYNPDWVYEVYAMPLRVCDIRLEPGERALDVPFISDSERWNVGAAVSLENNVSVQHIYVKPADAGQEASLIINTDRRVYHVILRSYKGAYMPLVRWRYRPGMPQNYVSPPQNADGPVRDAPASGIDPRFISFNYRMTFQWFSKPVWLPKLVFDDGSKTYVAFPEQVLQRELPSVFENRKDVLNYRVTGNVIIIDKLIENITVKIGKNEITVTKKRGN